MKITKRPYQADCTSAIVNGFVREGISCQGISLPCGAGKCVIVASLPSDLSLLPGESILFLAHRHELIDQAAEKFRTYNPTLTVSIERGKERAIPDADIVIGSIQSMTPSRIKKFDPDRYRVIAYDECHHLFSSAFSQRIVEYFGVHRSREGHDQDKLLIGLTATWRRGDNTGAEHLFEKIVFHRSTRDIMRSGIYVGETWCPYLAPIKGHRELSEIGLDKVHISKGELKVDELAIAMNTPERNNQVVDTYLEKGENMPAIAFTVDIQHSIDLAKAFKDRGLNFEAVSGDVQRTGVRGPAMEAFRNGQIKGLVSCAAISEGTDLPMASVGLNVCPTLSQVNYCQKFGRISRPWPAPEQRLADYEADTQAPWIKPYGIWIDFTDSSTKHTLIQSPTLFGLRPDFDFKGKDMDETIKEIEHAKAIMPDLQVSELRSLEDLTRSSVSFSTTDALLEATDIRKWSKYPWSIESAGQWSLVVKGSNSVYRVREVSGKFQVWVFSAGSGRYKTTVATLKLAVQEADRQLSTRDRKLLRLDAPWRREAPTPAQCEALWQKDSETRRRFRDGGTFYRFAQEEHAKGVMEFSKGALGDMLGIYVMANRTFHQPAAKQGFISKAIAGIKRRFTA